MNKVIMIGNLTKDPELRTTQGGVSVCSFTVAVQRRFVDQSGQRPTDFIPVVAWRKLAELCGKHLAKGRPVAVEGALQMRNYEDKDGNRRTVFEIQAEQIQFLGAKPEREKKGEAEDVPAGFADVSDAQLPF